MKRILFTLFILVSFTATLTAQQEKDSINTEVINVVTSYTPAISDAFKAKDNPTIGIETKKKNLKYRISSSPIRSIFRPNIGGYRPAKTPGKNKFYANYLKLGYGNFGTPLLEGFLSKHKKEHDLSFFLYNKASNGGIDKVQLEDAYMNTQVELAYKNTQKKHSWETNIAYHRNAYNWYGLPSEINFDNVINSIEEEQVYNTISVNGALNLKKGKLKRTALSLSHFSDKLDSKEMQIGIYPHLEFPISKDKVVTDFSVEYLNGEFARLYNDNTPHKYGFVTLGTHVYFPLRRENLFLSIGAKFKFNSDLENGAKDKAKFYPDVKVNYVILDELINIYAGLNGDLYQNNFQNLTSLNPFLSPTAAIRPTDNSFNVFGGLKGKLTATIDYNIKASYKNEDNKVLFRKNESVSDGTVAITNGYEAGNSFDVLYDDIKTFNLFGQINAIVTNNITAGASVEVNSYTLETLAEAWNLPTFEANAYGKYTHNKWSGKAELFVVGKRKDYNLNTDALIFLDAYADLNLDVNYAFTPKWNAFIEFNNLLNTDYDRFVNFEVQGFQVLAGFMYRF